MNKDVSTLYYEDLVTIIDKVVHTNIYQYSEYQYRIKTKNMLSYLINQTLNTLNHESDISNEFFKLKKDDVKRLEQYLYKKLKLSEKVPGFESNLHESTGAVLYRLFFIIWMFYKLYRGEHRFLQYYVNNNNQCTNKGRKLYMYCYVKGMDISTFGNKAKSVTITLKETSTKRAYKSANEKLLSFLGMDKYKEYFIAGSEVMIEKGM
ncbi:hypothetical protein ACVWU4_001043 [Campylobacter coli]